MEVIYKDKIYKNSTLKENDNPISYVNTTVEFKKTLRIKLPSEEHIILSVGNDLEFYITFDMAHKEYFYIKSRINDIKLLKGISVIDLSVYRISDLDLNQIRTFKLKNIMA